MTVLTKKRLRQEIVKNSEAKNDLMSWYSLMRKNQFSNIVELRKIFRTADAVGEHKDLICFNILHNRYRLICRITWGKTVFIKDFLTHGAYGRKYC